MRPGLQNPEGNYMLNFAKDLAAALDALRRHAILFFLGITLVALALLGRSWLDAHDASLRLQATLAAQQKNITDADQRQSTRDAQLTQTLAQITAAKQKVQTPTQAATALTQSIPQLIAGAPGGRTLPSPITIELPTANVKGNASTNASRSAGILPAGSPTISQNKNSQLEAGTTNSSADSASSKISSTAKYPWTALRWEFAKLGLGHATDSSANKDLENQKGSTTSQKGSGTSTNTQGKATTQAGASTSANSSTQTGSSAQTNSPPPTGTSALNNLLSTQINSTGTDTPSSQSGPQTAIIRVPQEDLKPLYDAVEDCQICQAKLTAAQDDLSDEKTKFAAATVERDAAIAVARGTFWKRIRTAAKWIVIGAAAGAVLSRYH
jgi:hypothetical protein